MKKILYLCDPSKNKECKKTVCQIICRHTTSLHFAKLDDKGKPIIADCFPKL